ncbi:MAG: hypothetical protein JWN87_43, partial [Frankiales bacterium]|nr:hypothetical protein [Frankiales bacterium]
WAVAAPAGPGPACSTSNFPVIHGTGGHVSARQMWAPVPWITGS